MHNDSDTTCTIMAYGHLESLYGQCGESPDLSEQLRTNIIILNFLLQLLCGLL